MGQAVADLPDPIESASPAEAQSADDLLSQLAGDEIDRLLAESDGEAAPPVKPAAPVAPAASAAATAPPAPAASVDLDAVLETAAAARLTSMSSVESSSPKSERSALQGVAPAPVVAPPADRSPHIELGDCAHRVPLILRPLEWLSSPLDPWPDQLREILGKIGLMTLINALAVLAYVLLVRRHHH